MSIIKNKNRKAFTLVELTVAVALLVMMFSFSTVIFDIGIESHRKAGANAEIMQKFRAITEQLNADLKNMPKDGYLVIHCRQLPNRRVTADSAQPKNIRSDSIYFFSTGEFHSWYDSTLRSNAARLCIGHERRTFTNPTLAANKWKLVRNTLLLTPGFSAQPDCADAGYAECRDHVYNMLGEDPNGPAGPIDNPPIVNASTSDSFRHLFAENVGQFKIQWTDGINYLFVDPQNPTITNQTLAWFDLQWPRKLDGRGIIADLNYHHIEDITPPYEAAWTPSTRQKLWPKALKFTFTIYDSKEILKNGKTFTHIVYLDR